MVPMLGAGALILSLTQAAIATTKVRLNLDQLTAAADDVVLGRVLYSLTAKDKVTGEVVTETHVAVDRYLKSSGVVGFGSPYVRVRQLGGYLAPYGFKVPGTASFRSNEWVVVFLKRDKTGAYGLVGWGQGKFDVVRGAGGQVMVQGSTTEVPEAIGAPAKEGTVSEGADDSGVISLESFERRVRGLAAIHKTFRGLNLDPGKAKGSQ